VSIIVIMGGVEGPPFLGASYIHNLSGLEAAHPAGCSVDGSHALILMSLQLVQIWDVASHCSKISAA
jgi:hypothetical protein